MLLIRVLASGKCDEECQRISTFQIIFQLTRQDDFWVWTHGELLPTLFPPYWYNGADRTPDGFLADHYSQLVGGARMRLLRVKTGT